MSERQEKYKNMGKSMELRRSRIDTAVELRKIKKEHKFSKRRFIEEIILPKMKERMDIRELNEILKNLANNSFPELQENVGVIRQCLIAPNPPIDLVLESEALPVLIKCLMCNECPTLQYETAWVLTNIAAGDSRHTRQLVESGVVPCLVSLLSSDVIQTKNQVLWALGNISGDCAKMRDLCVDAGFVNPLVSLINENSEVSTLRICAWTVSNLCRYTTPVPRMEVIKFILPYIKTLLFVNDSNVISDSLWAILYLGDASEDYIKLVVESGLIQVLATLLATFKKEYTPQILRIFGNTSFMDDSYYSQVLVDNGVVESIKKLMVSSIVAIRKDSLWVLSNIAAGNTSQINFLITSGCLEIVYEKLKNDKPRVKCEAFWVFKNIFADGLPEQIMYVVNLDRFVNVVVDLFSSSDRALSMCSLECTYAMLNSSRKAGLFDKVCMEIEIADGLDSLGQLQISPYQNVSSTASCIVNEFFQGYLEESEDV